MSQSLEDIAVGDVVIVQSGYGSMSVRQVTNVTKVTKSHFQVEGFAANFRKSSGTRVTKDRWDVGSVCRPRPGEIDEIRRESRARKDRKFVEDYIESIRDTPAAFVPLAEFIRSILPKDEGVSE